MSSGKKLKKVQRNLDENESSNEKTFSVSKENNDNEYDVALEFGDSNISPPENMKQIMESIIQDSW